MRQRNTTLLATCLGLIGWMSLARSANVNWEAAENISGDKDISTLGVIDRAFSFGSSTDSPGGVTTTIVNGVTFSAFGITPDPTTTIPSVSIDSTTLSGLRGVSGYNCFGSSVAPYSDLTPAYQALLNHGATIIATTASTHKFTLTLGKLTVGQKYLFQVFASDSYQFGAPGYARATFVSDGTNSVALNQNTSDATGGTGQYVIGTFTANATTQTFIFDRSADVSDQINVNGFQLRAIPKPLSKPGSK